MAPDIRQLSLEKKASLLCGAGFFTTTGAEEAGIPSVRFLDGGTGINYEQLFGDLFKDQIFEQGYSAPEFYNAITFFFEEEKLSEKEKEVREKLEVMLEGYLGGKRFSPGCYPPGSVLACTWDPDTVRKVGSVLGMEARLYRISCLLGTPNVNILRDPRNGRFFEGYSEDPYLAGTLASELVRGVNSQGVASNVKHYAANNLEIHRLGIDEKISARALREIYLPAFKKCVEAGVSTVMAAYNSINGVACVENRMLMRDILRDEWGFEGLVMTDWGACTGNGGVAVEAGTDLIMPGPRACDDIIAAAKDGILSQERLDQAAAKVAELSGCHTYEGKDNDLDIENVTALGDEVSYEAAVKGIVLLKNDNELFPVGEQQRIILFGSRELLCCGSGSAQVFTDRKITLKDAFPEALEDDFEAFAADPDSVALVVCSMGSSEGSDRPDLKCNNVTDEVISRLCEIKEKSENAGKIALILNTPGPVELEEMLPKLDSVFFVGYPGMAGARALADIVFGKRDVSGRLSFTFPKKYADVPSSLNYPDGFLSIYGEGIYVGYRGYEKRMTEPEFAFGHGLSYTSWEISEVSCDCDEYGKDDTVRVSFVLTNTGKRDGDQVVQIYVGDPVSMIGKPIKELRAYRRYHLPEGESIKDTLEIPVGDLRSYDEDKGAFLLESGNYDVYIGFSSAAANKETSFYVTYDDPEYRLGTGSMFKTIEAIPSLMEALKDDIIRNGLDQGVLINNIRYAPYERIEDSYKVDAKKLTEFALRCKEYRKS